MLFFYFYNPCHTPTERPKPRQSRPLSPRPERYVQTSFLSPDSDLCQRWSGGSHSWRHRSEGGFDRSRYDVEWIRHDRTASSYIKAHHYSRSYPAARMRFGLYERGAIKGVVVLSVPAQEAVLTKVFGQLVPYQESLELGRIVLHDGVPANAESWMIARVFELAARAGLRGVLAFSDPYPRARRDGSIVFPGHTGIIYQASNATYLGRGTPRTLHLLPDGTTLNDRTLQKIRTRDQGHDYAEALLMRWGARPPDRQKSGSAWLQEALEQADVRSIRHPGNHRYAFTLGPARRTIAVSGWPHPYPKRPDRAAAL